MRVNGPETRKPFGRNSEMTSQIIYCRLENEQYDRLNKRNEAKLIFDQGGLAGKQFS